MASTWVLSRMKLAAALLLVGIALYLRAPWIMSVVRTELGGIAFEQGQRLMQERPSEPNPYLDRALRNYQAAVAWNEHNAHAWRKLGEVYLTLGQNDPAREALERAVSLRPSFPLYHTLLGDAYDGMGDARQAVDAWHEGRAGILRRDRIVTNASKVADAHIQAGDPLSAVPVLRDEVLAVDPNNLFALATIVSAYDGAVSGPHPLADPYRDSALYPQADAYRTPSDERLSVYQARGAVRMYTGGYWDAGRLTNTIRYWAREGNPAGLLAAREVWEASPDDEGWTLVYAETLVREGLTGEAVALLERREAQSPAALRWLAIVKLEVARASDDQGSWQAARAALLRYADAAPDDLWTLAALADVCERGGLPEEAGQWREALNQRTELADRNAVAEALQARPESVQLGPNLVPNGGFEDWTGGTPDHWTWSSMATGNPWNHGLYVGGPEAVHSVSGQSAIVQGLWYQQDPEKERCRAGYWAYDSAAGALWELPVRAGQRYVVSLDYVTEPGAPATPTIWLSDDPSPCWPGDRSLPGTNGEWRHATFVCDPTAEGDDPLRPLVRLFGGGTAMFDNLQIREVNLAEGQGR